MPRVAYPVTNYTAGELSPRLDIRVDLKRYVNGAALIRNAIVMPHGGVRKRPGSLHIFEVKDSAAPAPLLVPFEFNVEQAYELEFGNNYIRFYKNRALIVSGDTRTITNISNASTAVVTYTGTDPINGQQIVISGVTGAMAPFVNGRRFTVANVNAGANTLELLGTNSSGWGAYGAAGAFDVPVEVATTYTSAQIDDMSFAQSADTLYIAHKGHPLRKLTRSSHTAWSLTDAVIRNGPFRTINTDDTHYLAATVQGSRSIQGITRANPAVVTFTTEPQWRDGACASISGVSGMTQVNGNTYILRNINVSARTAELWNIDETRVNSTGFSTYVSGGTASTAATIFGTISPGSTITLTSTDSIFETGHVGALFRLWEPGQSTGVSPMPPKDAVMNNGDMITNDGKVYGTINFFGDNAWYLEFQPPTHERGVVRVAILQGTKGCDVVFLHDTSCVIEILSYSSATSVVARVVRNHIPSSVVAGRTSLWEEGAWSGYRGYPGVIVFHESRLFGAASIFAPQTVWASRTGQLEDFQDGADDDAALVYEIASQSVDVIKWMSPGRVLLLGTPSSEYAVAASSQNEALTPSNLSIKKQTGYGSSVVRPVRVGQAVLIGERKGNSSDPARKVREVVYRLEADAFVAPDITIASEHITGGGIVALAYQGNPDSVVWSARDDGQLPALTYETEQEVTGWHLHTVGGVFGNYDYALVERISTLPGPNGTDLWMVVKRTINGDTKRYIEILSDGIMEGVEKEDCIYLDSALTYDGSPTTTITGLWHLEGQTVDALADGYKVSNLAVTNGSISLDEAASLVHVGLKYKTIIESLDFEAGAAAGTAKSRKKRITNVFLDVYRSLGGKYGYSEAKQYDILYRVPGDLVGSSPDLKTGLVRCSFPNRWERNAKVRVEHDDPYPFTLLGLVAEMTTTG